MPNADDELAIRSLAAAYTDAVNRRDWAGMAAVYAPDGQLSASGGEPVMGREKITKLFRRLIEKEREFVMQLTHSGVVEIDGDMATARWWFSEIKRPTGGMFEMILGVYQDRIVRTPEGWRFASRAVAAPFRWELPEPPVGFGPLPSFLPLTGLPMP